MATIDSGLQLESLVQTVLDTPRITPPPATLTEARGVPGRDEKIAALQQRIEAEGIEYVFFQQVSVSGHVNGKGVVGDFFSHVAKNGYQLVYGATADLFLDRHMNYIGFGPHTSELAAVADLDTFKVLPWDPRVARVYCDCYDTETGGLLEADPRQNLKNVAHEVEAELSELLGAQITFMCGIEPEMMWFRERPTGGEEPVGLTKPWCYHINQFEQLREVILDVVSFGKQMGLRMSYGDHEDSPGQLELNFAFDRAVRTADNLTTYRQICAAVGRKHGLFPSFMPKPFTGVSANGAHHHFTLVDESGKNVFYDPSGPATLSDAGRSFLGGILRHYRALTCVSAPTVNSYKRFFDEGFWAPINADYGWQNRTCAVRVAGSGRFEYRSVDSSCNPYLTQAALLVCGLEGVRDKVDPGPPQSENVYEVLDRGIQVGRVPNTLGEALDALEEDETVKSALRGHLYEVFRHYKRDEWERFCAAVTDWEREQYFDILP